MEGIVVELLLVLRGEFVFWIYGGFDRWSVGELYRDLVFSLFFDVWSFRVLVVR